MPRGKTSGMLIDETNSIAGLDGVAFYGFALRSAVCRLCGRGMGGGRRSEDGKCAHFS